jgi:hypothetical protein
MAASQTQVAVMLVVAALLVRGLLLAVRGPKVVDDIV